jgi:predicted CoA-binding protein
MCAQQHFNICKRIGIKLDKERWHEHVPKSVETSVKGRVSILWNQQGQTNKTIPNSTTDIIICEIEKGICMLMDAGISRDRTMIKSEAEKV